MLKLTDNHIAAVLDSDTRLSKNDGKQNMPMRGLSWKILTIFWNQPLTDIIGSYLKIVLVRI